MATVRDPRDKQKTFTPAKWRIKASSCAAENCLVAWPHPSLGGEVPRSIGADENSQIVILTPDSEPPSRLPIQPALAELDSGCGSLWSVTVALPSPNLTGFPDI